MCIHINTRVQGGDARQYRITMEKPATGLQTGIYDKR